MKNPLRRVARLFLDVKPLEQKPSWLKSRGYLHITPKIDLRTRSSEVISKVQNEDFVAKHAFFPLIHSVIKERKYKKLPGKTKARAHSIFSEGKIKSSAKLRPLHYATHIDSMIFGYYAQLISDLYEMELSKFPGLSDCITAYRKIKIEIPGREKPVGKSTIHFAKDAFDEIKRRASEGCVVLMFDIKSFFSEINHEKLKKTGVR
ncbi:hypothetical protein ACQ86N_17665 [Puia sp. P3]|uniref:hypothetical protein n=1 Tax=Puia sp. P3 TaxID=3423952 RepID=UPI003D678748